jgi:hypothetical protein
MSVLSEGQLTFDFGTALNATKFDDAGHGLSHCMKAVDFIVEFHDRYLFVEVKDPADTSSTQDRRTAFAAKLNSGVLCKTLTGKIRDSLLYRWAADRLDKPVYYLVLLELPYPQDPAAYVMLNDALRVELPVKNLPATWAKPLVAGAAVLNMAQWNSIATYGTVTRVP